MEFKAGTIQAKLRGLNTVLQIDGLDNRANYGFARMGPVIEMEYRTFETARQELIEKHAERDENGEVVSTSQDEDGQYIMVDQAAFQMEFEKLASEIVTVTVQPVRLSLILESEGCVNGATMIQLGELIEDDLEEEEKPPIEIVKKRGD